MQEGKKGAYPMKILVFSDSHGTLKYMEAAIAAQKPDHIVHLGDYVRDAEALRIRFPQIPITNVPGNCDYGDPSPTDKVITLDGIRIFMTHGHRYQVKYMYLRAIYAALEQEANILLFGHTHRAECFEEKGLWAMNPGAAGTGSYGIITIDNGSFQMELRNEN